MIIYSRSAASFVCKALAPKGIIKCKMPIHSCVGAIANRGQCEQGCSLFMATELGPVGS